MDHSVLSFFRSLIMYNKKAAKKAANDIRRRRRRRLRKEIGSEDCPSGRNGLV